MSWTERPQRDQFLAKHILPPTRYSDGEYKGGYA